VVTKVKKASAFNPVEIFVQHLSLKKDASTITTRSEALKKRLKEWLPSASDAYTNEQGSVFYDLPETVNVGGQDYKGMELRRAVSSVFDEDEATKILKRKGVYDQALTPVLDQDKIYRLVQEGKITESDLDKMFEQRESFAFWPLKGEVL
jgi:hypothetical protein